MTTPATDKYRRLVTLVHEQPSGRASKARLFAFGLEAMADATGQALITVKRHVQAGKVDPRNLGSVALYIRAHVVRPARC